jgi:hypothetical protein
VQRHQRQQQQFTDLGVVGRRQLHGGAGDEARERPGEGDFVVAQQARAYLRRQQQQQREHRPSPQGVVPDQIGGIVDAAQVAQRSGGGR